jgi:hypothetical protein
MSIDYANFQKLPLRSQAEFDEVKCMADRLLDFLRCPDIERQIESLHKLGASSADVQSAILPCAKDLGFASEKKGLFNSYPVSALRPDYYAKVGLNSGVLLEVERGKTTANNMDLLDLWKCHICEHADYLFLIVPKVRPSKKGSFTYPFNQVQKRLGTFFVPRNYVSVEGVFLFGY